MSSSKTTALASWRGWASTTRRWRPMNPRLIYASISGYGQTGPAASSGGFDLVAQGVSGIMSVTGEPGRPPVKAGLPLTDLGAGLFALSAILAALHWRDDVGARPIHRHLAVRSRHRLVGVGGDGVFLWRDAAAARLGASHERAVSGVSLCGRLHHDRRGQRSHVRQAGDAARSRRVARPTRALRPTRLVSSIAPSSRLRSRP